MPSHKVMIVDDELELRELVETILERVGYKVITAESGEKALEKLKKVKPDMVLLDVRMPGLNGWQTLEEISRRGIVEEAPVVMFTVEKLSFVQILRKDIENLVGYIEKPFTSSELVETTERIIDKTKKAHQLGKKIEESPSGGKTLADAFMAWNRTQMIHERLLEKLNQLKEKTPEKQKLARIENLVEGEKHTIKECERKKKEIIKEAGFEELVSEI